MPTLEYTDCRGRRWTSQNSITWTCEDALLTVRYVYDGPDFEERIEHYWELSRPYGKYDSPFDAMDAANGMR